MSRTLADTPVSETPSERPQDTRGRFLAGIFTEHPASVDETYWGHARFALGFSGRLFLASLAALVHAVLPFAFETTAGRMIRAMHARIEGRH